MRPQITGDSVKVLYAGDSPVGGAANYLLGVLKFMKADVTHVPPAQKMPARLFKKKYDVILLSDYSHKKLLPGTEEALVRQVKAGAGLLMVGGWGSFSGPFGGWRGSLIETVLPVSCSAKDDRLNFPGGASVGKNSAHQSIKNINLNYAPVICGMNRVIPRKKSKVVLHARKNLSNGKKIRLDSSKHPLLIVSEKKGLKTAAFTCDFAPHWCGGLVDWGKTTLRLPVNPKIQIQVGDYYVRLISGLIAWLAS